MSNGPFQLHPIGWVESSLLTRDAAPRQGDEGAPDAWIVFEQALAEGLRDVQPGGALIVLTWLDRARRDVLRVHPRGDSSRPEQGVFSTRSPDRPNPIGLHRVEVVAIEGVRLHVHNLEALDGTPVLDLKPVLATCSERGAGGDRVAACRPAPRLAPIAALYGELARVTGSPVVDDDAERRLLERRLAELGTATGPARQEHWTRDSTSWGFSCVT